MREPEAQAASGVILEEAEGLLGLISPSRLVLSVEVRTWTEAVMARIAGIDLPRTKRAEIGLTYIYGIGRTRSLSILSRAGIDPNKKVKDLTEDEATQIRQVIEEDGGVEGDLRKEVALEHPPSDRNRLVPRSASRRSLPVRGQRTHTNARTRKGPRKGTSPTRRGHAAKT